MISELWFDFSEKKVHLVGFSKDKMKENRNLYLHRWKQINMESWKTTTWIVCTDEWNLVVLYPPRILKLLFKC